MATRTVRGGSAFGIYPFDRYRRVEFSGGLVQLDEQYNDPALQQQSQQYQQQLYGTTVLPQRHAGAARAPRSSRRRRSSASSGRSPAARCGSPTTSRRRSGAPVAADVRRRRPPLPAARQHRLLATRIRGFKSFGDFPDFLYFGGNSELRGYDYLEFAGQNAVFANAELRFPLIEAALTPIGVIGGIRGVFFAGIGGAWFNNQPTANPCTGEASGFKFATNSNATCQVPTGSSSTRHGQLDRTTNPQTGQPIPVLNYAQQRYRGFRLKDGRASYGLGLETFALGFPIHFDWSWRTLFNNGWEDVVFACSTIDNSGKCVSGAADSASRASRSGSATTSNFRAKGLGTRG